MDKPTFARRKSSTPSSPILIARHSSTSLNLKSKNISNNSNNNNNNNNNSNNNTINTNSIRRKSFNSIHNNDSLFDDDISITDNILNVNLDNSLPLDFFKNDILSVIKSLKIPKWRKINTSNYKLIHLDRISGAMTNCVYKITYKNYYPLLLRLYGDVENIIDRNSELLTLIRLSKKNIGPKLLGCFNNGRFEEFLNNSITLNKLQIRDAKISRMIARRMKEFHYGVNLTYDEFNNGPKSWLLIEKWLIIVENLIKNSNFNDQKNIFIINFLNFKKLVLIYKNWLYSHYKNLEILKNSLKFCHNDAQYGNLLFYNKSDRSSMSENDNDDNLNNLIDDNEITSLSLSNNLDNLSINSNNNNNNNTNNNQLPIITDTNYKYDTRLTVIDFEYAGPNPPAYDITNHFSEWMYDYNDPVSNYKTDESKYPSVEERINYLNSYIQYIPGSTTPSFIPQSSSNSLNFKPTLNKSSSVVSIKLTDLPSNVTNLYNETIYWRSTSSIFWALWAIISKGSINNNEECKFDNENKKDEENSKTQENYLQGNNSSEIEFKLGPNGEKYKIIDNNDTNSNDSNIDSDSDDEFSKPTLDDEFDHLKYALGKIGIFIGDMIQFGLLKKDEIDPEFQKNIKYLDTNLLPL